MSKMKNPTDLKQKEESTDIAEEHKYQEIQPETPEVLMDIHSFCSLLPQDGVDKYAYVRIASKLKEWNKDFSLRTHREWEEIYTKIKNS